MKKLLSVTLAACMFFSLCSPAYAVGDLSAGSKPPADYGEPVQVTTYYDEELDAEVTERMYFVPDEMSTFSEKSGRGWYKNEKTFSAWNNGRDSTTYFVEAYFVWGNGEVSVSDSDGDYDWLPSGWHVTSEDTVEGTGQYAWVLNKFAYATYTLNITSTIGLSKTFTVTIRLSESGNMI